MSISQYDDEGGIEPDYGRRMSHTEAVALCRYAKAACPQQTFDQYTPDAWSDLLGDLRFEDCQEALKYVVKRQPFVSPAEIRARVKSVRSKRIGEYGGIPHPPDNLSVEESRAWQADFMRRVGDGEVQLTPEEIEARKPPWISDHASHASRARAAVREAVATIPAAPEPEPLTTDADRLREPARREVAASTKETAT